MKEKKERDEAEADEPQALNLEMEGLQSE